jgi:hypothetical protein
MTITFVDQHVKICVMALFMSSQQQHTNILALSPCDLCAETKEKQILVSD